MKRLIQKLKSRAGLTLAETLLTVVILLLASGIVATGMPAAVSAYRNAIDAANAQVLLSAAVNALRGELSTARDVKVSDDKKTIIYTDAETGSRMKICLGKDPQDTSDTDTILVQEYEELDDSGNGFLTTDEKNAMAALKPKAYALLSKEARKTTRDGKSKMTVLFTDVTPNNGVLTISGLKVERDGTVLAKMPGSGLTIRVLTGGGGA